MKEEVGVGHLELPMRREISSKLHELNIAIAQLVIFFMVEPAHLGSKNLLLSTGGRISLYFILEFNCRYSFSVAR